MNTDLDNDDFYYCSQFLLGIPLPQIQNLNWDQSLAYCRLLEANLQPDDIAALRSVGMDDAEIIDLIHAISIFGWANRLMHVLGHAEAGK